MRAGKLRHKVDIQYPTETQNTYGEPEVTWTDLATGVWCQIQPLRGREFFESRQFNAEIDARIVMRHRSDVTAKMRIMHGSDEYYVDSVINVDERDREVQLMCTRSIE